MTLAKKTVLVGTHSFRDAFLFRGQRGYALVFAGDQLLGSFLVEKYDPAHVRLTVFESVADAEDCKRRCPATMKLTVQAVAKDDVVTFATQGSFGGSLIVFLRDGTGDEAIL